MVKIVRNSSAAAHSAAAKDQGHIRVQLRTIDARAALAALAELDASATAAQAAPTAAAKGFAIRSRTRIADNAKPSVTGLRGLTPSTRGLLQQAASTAAAILKVLDSSEVRLNTAEETETPEAASVNALEPEHHDTSTGAPIVSSLNKDDEEEEAALAPELQALLAQIEAAGESAPIGKIQEIRSELEKRLRAMKRLNDVQTEMAALTQSADPAAQLAAADSAISAPTAGREGRGAALAEIVTRDATRSEDATSAIAAAEAGMSRAISDAIRVKHGMDAAPWTADDLYEYFRAQGKRDATR